MPHTAKVYTTWGASGYISITSHLRRPSSVFECLIYNFSCAALKNMGKPGYKASYIRSYMNKVLVL